MGGPVCQLAHAVAIGAAAYATIEKVFHIAVATQTTNVATDNRARVMYSMRRHAVRLIAFGTENAHCVGSRWDALRIKKF
jgi:hypothetical protein